MASDTPAHDFLLPRLAALVNETVQAGYSRDVAVAVLIDLVTSPTFDTAQVDPADAKPRGPAWERTESSLPLVGGAAARAPDSIGRRDEADFIQPIYPMRPA